MSETNPPPVCCVCGTWIWPEAGGFVQAYRVERIQGWNGQERSFLWYCSPTCLRKEMEQVPDWRCAERQRVGGAQEVGWNHAR